jgi:hypothetical protein
VSRVAKRGRGALLGPGEEGGGEKGGGAGGRSCRGDPFMAATGLRRARATLGPVSVVQADTRYCALDPGKALAAEPTASRSLLLPRLHYWWESARANALWAERYGYRHRLYCLEAACEHRSGARLFVAWCKLRALRDAVGDTGSRGAGSTFPSSASSHSLGSTADAARAGVALFLDSDAFWQRPEMSIAAMMQQYIPEEDWQQARGADQVGIFFGCNLPWNGEDRGRRQWNATTLHGERGPPGTGVMLLLHSPVTRELLDAWWDVATWNPTWNRKFAWEQSALWELWAQRRSAAERMRVLHDAAANKCMRSMDPRHPSPIAHVAGGSLAPGRREARLDAMGLRALVHNYTHGHGATSACAWRSEITWIAPSSSSGAGRQCASQRLEVSDRGDATLGGCLT